MGQGLVTKRLQKGAGKGNQEQKDNTCGMNDYIIDRHEEFKPGELYLYYNPV